MTDKKEAALERVMAVIHTLDRPCSADVIARIAGVSLWATIDVIQVALCRGGGVHRQKKAAGETWYCSRMLYRQLLPQEGMGRR
jgi:hypothetical protein